jgi:hypothetical protein
VVFIVKVTVQLFIYFFAYMNVLAHLLILMILIENWLDSNTESCLIKNQSIVLTGSSYRELLKQCAEVPAFLPYF